MSSVHGPMTQWTHLRKNERCVTTVSYSARRCGLFTAVTVAGVGAGAWPATGAAQLYDMASIGFPEMDGKRVTVVDQLETLQ